MKKIELINYGAELHLYKYIDGVFDENDYAILDRKNGKSYRVKNGVKRENKDLRSFATGITWRNVITRDEYIKKLIQIIYHSTDLRNGGGIINELITPRVLCIEKWLKIENDNFPPEESNGRYYSYSSYSYYPNISPDKISKSIRNDLCQDKEKFKAISFINNIGRMGDAVAQNTYYNIFKTINEFINLPENYRLTADIRTWIQPWNPKTDYRTIDKVIRCIIDYKVDLKTFLEWIKKINFTENLTIDKIFEEWSDYISMQFAICKQRTSKINKYPTNLLTEHQKIVKDYNAIKQEYDEYRFKKSVEKIQKLKYHNDDYTVVIPKTSDDIKDEAEQQHNCVRSYINDVIEERTNILFIRKTDDVEHSLITVEVDNNFNIIQAYRHYNNRLTKEDKQFVKEWCNKKGLTKNARY